MKILIYLIHKEERVSEEMQHYIKACKSFGVEVAICHVFTKEIQLAQKKDTLEGKDSKLHCANLRQSNFTHNDSMPLQSKEPYLTSKLAYTKAFESYLDSQSILLDERGRLYDSLSFSVLLESMLASSVSAVSHKKNSHFVLHRGLKFFIAGAFGFHSKLLARYRTLSLSPLTFSHNIAKVVLLEQIYRALSLLNNHPYHK